MKQDEQVKIPSSEGVFFHTLRKLEPLTLYIRVRAATRALHL